MAHGGGSGGFGDPGLGGFDVTGVGAVEGALGGLGGLDVSNASAVAARTGFTGRGFMDRDFFSSLGFDLFAEQVERDLGLENPLGRDERNALAAARLGAARKATEGQRSSLDRGGRTAKAQTTPAASIDRSLADVPFGLGNLSLTARAKEFAKEPDKAIGRTALEVGSLAVPGTLALQGIVSAMGIEGKDGRPTGPGPTPGPSRSGGGSGRNTGVGGAENDGPDAPDGSENQPFTGFGQPTTNSSLTGATATSPSPDQLEQQSAEQAAFDAQAAADSEAFESARLAQVETERVERERVAEETSRTRAEEAASNVRSNVRPQAASSDPIRLLAPNPDNDNDNTTPQERARFLTSGGPLGLTGTRANVRRPTLFGA